METLITLCAAGSIRTTGRPARILPQGGTEPYHAPAPH